MTVIGDIQSLLLMFMCNVANTYSCKKFSCSEISDHTEQIESYYFVDAVIAFCKLQHLIPNVPIKTQVRHIPFLEGLDCRISAVTLMFDILIFH